MNIIAEKVQVWRHFLLACNASIKNQSIELQGNDLKSGFDFLKPKMNFCFLVN